MEQKDYPWMGLPENWSLQSLGPKDPAREHRDGETLPHRYEKLEILKAHDEAIKALQKEIKELREELGKK